MKIIVAIDIGSSSVRCSAYSEDEKGMTSALDNCITSRKMRCVEPNTGKIQLFAQNNEQRKSLMDTVDDCIDELLEILRNECKKPFEVVGIGISSFVMNLVGVDKQGCVVGEDASLSYACNTAEVAQQCRNLRSRLSEEDIQHLYQQTGAPIHSAYALPQLLEVYNCARYAKVRESVYQWQSIASLCVCRWIGEICLPISFSEASWTGLLDFRTCQYAQQALDLLPEECLKTLPALADFSDDTNPQLANGIQEICKDRTKNPYWERWPELRGTSGTANALACRLFLGLGDGACANLGSKCSTVSRIAVTVGTSAAARICLPLPVSDSGGEATTSNTLSVPKGLFCYRINRAHVLVGGALTDGGSVIEWVSTLLNLSSPDSLNECFEKVENVVVEDYVSAEEGQLNTASFSVIPFLSGERSTGFRDNASCAMLGLTRSTTPAHMVKSCLEGVTLRLNAILRLIRQSMEEVVGGTQQDLCIIASGKALEANSLWRQLISDCSGMEVIMDEDTQEGTSRGVAVAVSVALESPRVNFLEEPLRVSTKSKPNPTGKIYWKQAETSQERLLEAVSPLY